MRGWGRSRCRAGSRLRADKVGDMTDRDHRVEAIATGARRLLQGCQERARILDAIMKAINDSEAVRALIYASESAAAAKPRLMDLLDIDEDLAGVVLDMQSRRLAAAERLALSEEYRQLTDEITECRLILDSPDRQRELVGTDRGEYLARYADFT
jgi:DNA gyrase subunit A